MDIQKQYLTISNYNRPGSIRPRTTAVACHYIGNPGTSAKANRNWFESLAKTHDTKASCHYIIGLEGEILQLIPEEEISWCTNSANSYTISIEACHPDNSGKFAEATYKSYVELCADICKRWGLDPLNGGLIRHYDVTRKHCPKWFVTYPEEWERFKRDVDAAMMHPNKSGWHQEDGGWRYYLGNTGEPIRNDWHQEDNGDWYWFDGAGMKVCNAWKAGKDGKWYYLGPDGKMLRDTWLLLGKELYRLNGDGSTFEGRVTLTTNKRGALVIEN